MISLIESGEYRHDHILSAVVISRDNDRRRALARVLGSRYPVLYARNMGEGLRMAKSIAVDLVVLDAVSMNTEDGVRVLYEMRDSPIERVAAIMVLVGQSCLAVRSSQSPEWPDGCRNELDELPRTILVEEPVSDDRLRVEAGRLTGYNCYCVSCRRAGNGRCRPPGRRR